MQEYDRLHEFEDAVLNQLPCLGDSSTFGCELQFVHKDTLPFVLCIYKTLTDNHVEAVIVTQSVPNGVDQHFVSVLMNKLQLTTKGAAASKAGELIQHCIFKLIKPVILLQVDC